MIHPPPRTGPLTALLLLLIIVQLTACRPASTDGAAATPPAHTSTAPPTISDAESALRLYYESLLADLNQALLDAKQSDYINKKIYEERIAELESRLESLESPSDPPDEATDIPVSSSPTPPAETTSPPAPSAFTYTTVDGAVIIRAYLGSDSRVTIPAAIAGLPVTHIADDAFRATTVVAVTLPDTVTEIGWFAFADCPDLTAVTLPASVKTIGYGAFEGSPRVTLFCPEDSYAATYALSFGIPTEARHP